MKHRRRSCASVVRWLRPYASGILVGLLLLLTVASPLPAVASPPPAASGKLAATPELGVALHNDGTVWIWGLVNLGDERTIGSETPTRVSGLTGMVAVAAAGRTIFALKDDGTVWGWGYDSFGLLELTSSYDVPARKSGLTGIVSIAVGPSHALAIKKDGTVWAWGKGSYGQLGNGGTSYSREPVQVQGLTEVVAVAVGDEHSVALRNDGTVWSWGSNYNCALGIGRSYNPAYGLNSSYNISSVPVMVAGLSGVTAVAAAGSQSFALKGDGTVWGWGNNSDGQLGDGSQMSRNTPIQAAAVPGAVAALAPSPDKTVALMADGTVWAWGLKKIVYGTRYTSLPEQAATLTGITAVASGGSFILALGTDGAIYAWGDNSKGQLGAGVLDPIVVPAKIAGLDSVSAVASCSSCYYTLAVRSDGTVWSWGDHGDRDEFVPVQVPGLENVIRVAAGAKHNLALKRDGTLWSWGVNDYGQLGNEGGTNSKVPLQVIGVTGVTHIAAGLNFSLATTSDGTVWSWGSNRFGSLGISVIEQTTFPLQVPGLSSVTDLSAGELYAMGLRRDGTVWVWGGHRYGNGVSSTPVAVGELLGVSRMAAGRTHALAMLTGAYAPSNVWSWGYNTAGELGDSSVTERWYPGAVLGIPEMKEIAAGSCFSLAVDKNGNVRSWGDNYYGQLGNGSRTSTNVATQVPQLSDVVQVAAGISHAVALKSDGTLWGWGRNDMGQTGINPGWLPVQALVNLGPQGEAPLSVTVSGSGHGTVYSVLSGIVCITGTCSRSFLPGTPVTLHATASSGSLFSGWGGACSGVQDCLLQMTSNRSVSANFSVAYPLRIGGSGYDTLKAAYNAAPAGAVIMSRDGDLPEGVFLADRDVAVKLAGGYYTNFSGRSGLYTRLLGKLLLRRGTVRVERVKIL